MSAWMFIPYAYRMVEKGEWTQEYANERIRERVESDLKADEFDREMIEHWRKLKESKN